MKMTSRLFGTIKYDENQVITFPKGLPGFQGSKDGRIPRRFVLKKSQVTDPVAWLLCVDEDDVELPLIDPVSVESTYTLDSLKINVDVQYALRGSKGPISKEDLLLFSVVTIPKNIRKMSVDLRAPILIDKKTKRGVQYSLSAQGSPRWSVRRNLYQEFVSGQREDRDGMLVISRRPNETVDIGDATVEVLSVDGNCVRLGVVAPQHVTVSRGTFPATPAGENMRANEYVNLKDLEAVLRMKRIISEPGQMPSAYEQRLEDARSAG